MEKIHQIGPSLGKEEKRELLSVINSGWFTEAKKTREFERMFCGFVGCKYATAVTSGTSALFIALKSIGIGKGDEIIVPDLTVVATATAVEMTEWRPESRFRHGRFDGGADWKTGAHRSGRAWRHRENVVHAI